MDPVAFLRELFDTCVQHAQADAALARHLPAPPKGRTVVIGAGKASAAMAQAFDALWPEDRPLSGVVVTRYGFVPPSRLGRGRIAILEAAHPVPDERGMAAVTCIREALVGLTEDDLVVALISGGGSSLLPAPWDGCELADEQALNDQLLRSGATINEMNVVRRHTSAVKGGRLAQLARPARVVTLAMSDVPGDRLEDIASGPTVPDPSTCAQALEILRRYGIKLPASLMAGLASGALETPKPGDLSFARDEAVLVVRPAAALQAAAELAQSRGIACQMLGDAIEGESREVAIVHAGIARAVRQGHSFKPPCLILSGGETTVTLPRSNAFKGSGGRCSEFVLACAVYLQGEPDVWVLAADTDGIDGRGDAAGAFATPETLQLARSAGLDARSFLARHDSGTFFLRLGAQVLSGPTHTNVNDFRALLVL